MWTEIVLTTLLSVKKNSVFITSLSCIITLLHYCHVNVTLISDAKIIQRALHTLLYAKEDRKIFHSLLHFSLRISRPSSSRLWKKPIKNSLSQDEPMACWYWSGPSLSRLTWASCPLSTMKPNWATPWQGEKSAFNYWILPPSPSSSSQVLFLSDTATLEYVSWVHTTCFVVCLDVYSVWNMPGSKTWSLQQDVPGLTRCQSTCPLPLFTCSKKAFLIWSNDLERQFVSVLWHALMTIEYF